MRPTIQSCSCDTPPREIEDASLYSSRTDRMIWRLSTRSHSSWERLFLLVCRCITQSFSCDKLRSWSSGQRFFMQVHIFISHRDHDPARARDDVKMEEENSIYINVCSKDPSLLLLLQVPLEGVCGFSSSASHLFTSGQLPNGWIAG